MRAGKRETSTSEPPNQKPGRRQPNRARLEVGSTVVPINYKMAKHQPVRSTKHRHRSHRVGTKGNSFAVIVPSFDVSQWCGIILVSIISNSSSSERFATAFVPSSGSTEVRATGQPGLLACGVLLTIHLNSQHVQRHVCQMCRFEILSGVMSCNQESERGIEPRFS